MKREKLFYVSALSMMLAFSSACSDEMVGHEAPPEADAPAVSDANTLELTSDEMTILRTMDGSSPKISQDEAISIAAKFLGQNQLSKSTSGVRCDVVTRKRSSISKQSAPESDTLMYVLNYGNNDGYAMVCADIRVPEQILAYSETGSMDTETDNPGVQLFMDMAEDYMDANIAEVESKRDSLEEVIQGKFAEVSEYQGKHLSKSRTEISSNTFQYYQSTETEITEYSEPMLHTFWHQDAPYNDYVPLCKDPKCKKGTHNSPAGCTAIATAQLMAYWKYPQYVNGVAMNWNSMWFSNKDLEISARKDNNYKHRVATLVEYVGKHCDMEYRCGSSGAWPEDAVVLLSQLGYSVTEMTSYREIPILQSLRNKRPVMLYGYEKYNSKTKTYSDGHTWILDGLITKFTSQTHSYMHIVTYREDNGSTTTEGFSTTDHLEQHLSYFHCNWGWDSDKDGYYLNNVFNTHGVYELNQYETDIDYKKGTYDTYENYKYNIKIAPNIHR